jgi:hypothetical protein
VGSSPAAVDAGTRNTANAANLLLGGHGGPDHRRDNVATGMTGVVRISVTDVAVVVPAAVPTHSVVFVSMDHPRPRDILDMPSGPGEETGWPAPLPSGS